MTAKDLKNALLQEAVQGRLVPQIASEGNARDLLEEIRKEKLSHGLDFANAKSGKRKSKKETALAGSNPCDITEEEIPFDIPESWCWCRLGDIINIKSGDGLTSSQMKKGNIPVFGGNGITGYHNISNIHKESIVIGRVGFYCGSVHITPNEAWVTDNAFITTYPEKQIDKRFLVYVLRHLNLGQDNNATAQPVVSGKKIYPIPFPLPPLAEQKRIVAAIEKFMPLIEEYGKKETQLKAINEKIGTLTKKAILQEAVQGKLVPQIASEGNAKDLLEEIRNERLSHGFANSYGICGEKDKKTKSSDLRSKSQIRVMKKTNVLPEITEDEIPFDIPESWCWCRLGEIAEITMGQSPEGINVGETVQGMEFHQGKIFFTDKIIGKSNQQTSEITKVAKENSILLCMRAPVGKINITDREICIGRGLSSIIPLFNVDTMFLYYLLETLESDFNKKATGSTFKAITGDIVRNQAIPLPPLAEQKRIVAAIEKMLPLCEKLGE